MKVIIKNFNELTLDELYEILKVRFEVFASEQKIICENDLDDKDKEAIHIFSVENGIVTGYLRILPIGIGYKESISIGRVLVKEDYRKRGIAKRLLKEAIRYIKENYKKEKIVLSAQIQVKSLYENLGFKEISEIYNEVNIPHVKMEYKY